MGAYGYGDENMMWLPWQPLSSLYTGGLDINNNGCIVNVHYYEYKGSII